MVNISAGSRHNLAVSADGNVYAWGYGSESLHEPLGRRHPVLTLLYIPQTRRSSDWATSRRPRSRNE